MSTSRLSQTALINLTRRRRLAVDARTEVALQSWPGTAAVGAATLALRRRSGSVGRSSPSTARKQSAGRIGLAPVIATAKRRKIARPPPLAQSTLSRRLLEEAAIFKSLKPGHLAADTLRALSLLRDPSATAVTRPGRWPHEVGVLVERFVKVLATQLDASGVNRSSQRAIPETLSGMFSTLPVTEDSAELQRWLVCQFIPWARSESASSLVSSATQKPFDRALHAAFDQVARLTDVRRPQDLFPTARLLRRKIHLHVGPTNSGKTYTALRALHGARNGVYAGPLRLLAHEVFHRFNAGLVAPDLPPRTCNLVTGEEQRVIDETAGLSACTVEMLSSNFVYDVCVIDEIQMIADSERGSAWTEAFLGVSAQELHLCGEESAVGLIRRLTDLCGDVLEVHRYSRLSPLRVADSSLRGDFSGVRRGDCVVTFTRDNIYALKAAIEAETGLDVGIAYGGLPPEIRERQAQLFNKRNAGDRGEGYDVLVGSDALGMGLNLKITRIIFESMRKFNGHHEIFLRPSQVKQIAGRAGRFSAKGGTSTNAPDMDAPSTATVEAAHGEVLTLHEGDMPYLRRCMESSFSPIKRAVFKPLGDSLRGLASLVPSNIGFPTLFGLSRALAAMNPNFDKGDQTSFLKVSEALEAVKGLTFQHRKTFASCPVPHRDSNAITTLKEWATAHAAGREVDFRGWIRSQALSELFKSPELNPVSKSDVAEGSPRSISSDMLGQLESVHRCLVGYLWLGCRLPQTFADMDACREWKSRVEQALLEGLKTARAPRAEQSKTRVTRGVQAGIAAGMTGQAGHVVQSVVI